MYIIEPNTPIIMHKNKELVFIENETKQVFDGVIQMEQIPNKFKSIIIKEKDGGKVFAENLDSKKMIGQGEYKVNYREGRVYFNELDEKKFLLLTYYGEGFTLISDCRIYTELDSESNVTETMRDVLVKGREGIVYVNKLKETVAEGTDINNQLKGTIVVGKETKKGIEDVIDGSVSKKRELGETIVEANNIDLQLKENVADSIIKNNIVKETIADSIVKDGLLKGTISKSLEENNLLKGTIEQSIEKDTTLKTSIEAGNKIKLELDGSIVGANTINSDLKSIIPVGDKTKTDLDESIETSTSKDNLLKATIEDSIIKDNSLKSNIADSVIKDTSLKGTIETSTSKDNLLKETIADSIIKDNSLKANIDISIAKDTSIKESIVLGNKMAIDLKVKVDDSIVKDNALKETILDSVKKKDELEKTIISADLGAYIQRLEFENKTKEINDKVVANQLEINNAKGDSESLKDKLTEIASNKGSVVAKSEINGSIKINGVETNIYTHPSGTNPHGTTKEDVGLGNVTNIEAISKATYNAHANDINIHKDIRIVSSIDETAMVEGVIYLIKG